MKKRVFLAVLIICLCFSAKVFAAPQKYEIKELYMTLDVPENYYVFTRDIDPNDKNLEKLGLTSEQLSTHFRASSIYFNGIDFDSLSEFVVVMNETDESRDIFDMSKLSDEELQTAVDYFMENFEKGAGKIFKESSIFKTDAATFLAFKFTSRENAYVAEGVQYYTIYNGQAINIILSGYDNSHIASAMDDMAQMIESISFTKTFESAAVAGNFNTSAQEFLPQKSTGYGGILRALISSGIMVLFGLALDPKRNKTR